MLIFLCQRMHLFSASVKRFSKVDEVCSALSLCSSFYIFHLLLIIAFSAAQKNLIVTRISNTGCGEDILKDTRDHLNYRLRSASNFDFAAHKSQSTYPYLQFFFSEGKRDRRKYTARWNLCSTSSPLLTSPIDVKGPYPPLKLTCLRLRCNSLLKAKNNVIWHLYDTPRKHVTTVKEYSNWASGGSPQHNKAHSTALLYNDRDSVPCNRINNIAATRTHRISSQTTSLQHKKQGAKSLRDTSHFSVSQPSEIYFPLPTTDVPVMAWRCTGHSNAELINNLRSAEIIRNNRVYEAMLKVDRANYVRNNPYADSPQSLGHGVTISAPHMHGHALELLHEQLKPGNRALDIGSGSGYLTVCMARMVDVLGNGGVVVGLELLPSLIDMSKRNVQLDASEFLQNPNFRLIAGDGWKGGPPEYAPYHAIHVGAAASEVPSRLIEQLANGGKMIIPVEKGFGQQLMEVTKDEAGNVKEKNLFGVAYVELKKSND
ncbi:L-isoaspartyl protein carboxyl methyltransferase family protein [Cardiosporidium cionae]|uniref:protein-L-isoaspartate(D-aspartate) O-methyltransferase n=1 Tax=Cardiosporidium cionae TaxID=476202 RepID=A0ABQ7JBG8_9APIC|nr:L-isoaspartyl protein carboxyl methyltransferase family protein [Cardiosporidium cionae]|eukprot:KAF8821348.1 L-isoaspartyl protein carboxyl methyltransferase family protein [Cardiosporidium cionae]